MRPDYSRRKMTPLIRLNPKAERIVAVCLNTMGVILLVLTIFLLVHYW